MRKIIPGLFRRPLVAGALIIPLLVSVAQAAGPDPASGKVAFDRACAVCHAVEADRNKVGPSLFGVVGRASASLPNYAYSDAMKSAHKTWDEDTLDTYLENPREDVPGTKMIYPGLKPGDQRADVIAYLKTLH